MNIIIALLIGYTLGCILAFDLIKVVEFYKNEKFTKKDKCKLALGSWYTCIILNNILDKNRYD